LSCSVEENLNRLWYQHQQKDRVQENDFNTDVETLKIIREEEELHQFGKWFGVHEMVIDVTHMRAVKAATEIKKFIDEIMRSNSAR